MTRVPCFVLTVVCWLGACGDSSSGQNSDAAGELDTCPSCEPATLVQSRVLTITNTGDAALLVSRFMLAGHQGFGVTFPGHAPRATSAETASGIVFDTPIRIAPDQHVEVTVTYSALGPEAPMGQLVSQSNDASAGAGSNVMLPTKVDFAGKLVGQSAMIQVKVT